MTDLPERSGPLDAVHLSESRDRVVQELSEHFAADHLEVAELERRLDRVFAVRTRAELDALLAGLPALPVKSGPTAESAGEPLPACRVEPGLAVPKSQTVVAIMGGAGRSGAWTPPRRLNVFVLMGGADVDFREARFGEPVTEITVVAIMGGLEIIVPPGVRVESNGLAIMGGFDIEQMSDDARGADAPLIKVNGFVLMGGVEIKVRLPGETKREARKRLKAERRRKRLVRGERA
ncbi:MAG: DUF1707 domain-containing protein [Gemmatimonadota bacterium]